MVVASAIGGIGWGVLVPAQHFLVLSGGRAASLTSESNHQFDAVALFLCLGLILGVLSAVAAWLWRSVRGAVVLTGLLIGSAVGAAAAAVVGLGVARLRFPEVTDVAVGQIVPATPTIGTPMALILQPFAAAVVYLLMASLNPRDDLGVTAPPAAEGAPADAPGPTPR
ncbi:DUF2567 domain-containing protein [Rhodococcus sp. NPDC127528]|uniref:DUF2567 domain-containing protein n=1 Tax=unclassified Rhodococcus (in: high G+C Gram-positive bacteria) TaxID=192944 RepID=UPI00364414D1